MGKKDEMKASNPFVHFFQENMGILVALAALCIFLEIMNQRFFTWSNWLTILDNVSKTGFLAIGIMLCIMLGGIDLIAGAGIACSGVLCIVCMERWHLPMIVAIIAGLLVGLIAGMLNGIIIAYSGIHPFVVTLAMQSILRGVAYLLANAQPVPLYVNEVFPNIGIARVMGIPLPIIYLIILFVIQWLLLATTKTGRYIYAVGGNETAARFSGINVEKIKILVWTFSGLLCAFAGIVLSAKLKSGQPSTSVGAETDAIASCVLGGTSMYGGTGRTSGVIIGVFIIGVISNGLTLMHLDVNWQYVVKGVIILVAVYSDMVRQRKSQARKE